MRVHPSVDIAEGHIQHSPSALFSPAALIIYAGSSNSLSRRTARSVHVSRSTGVKTVLTMTSGTMWAAQLVKVSRLYGTFSRLILKVTV